MEPHLDGSTSGPCPLPRACVTESGIAIKSPTMIIKRANFSGAAWQDVTMFETVEHVLLNV